MATSRESSAAGDSQQRAELVAAAARVLARHGVADTTTRKIAAEAGIPLGKIHYWFATKNDLLAEVVTQHVGQISSAVEHARPAADPGSSADLLTLFRAAFAVEEEADHHAGLASYELISWALRNPGQESLARRQTRAFREAGQELSRPWFEEHGEALGVPHDVLAQFLAALYDGLVLAWLADPEGTRPDEVFDLVSRLLAMAGERGADPRPEGRPEGRPESPPES